MGGELAAALDVELAEDGVQVHVTSDGALMYDHTVLVELVRTSDGTIAASHVYGAGAIHGYVQLDATTAVYKTHFKRGDFGVTLRPFSFSGSHRSRNGGR